MLEALFNSPRTTRPNITCFPSSQGQGTVVMKNWEPFCDDVFLIAAVLY